MLNCDTYDKLNKTEWKKEIAQEMVLYQTRASLNEVQEILVSPLHYEYTLLHLVSVNILESYMLFSCFAEHKGEV